MFESGWRPHYIVHVWVAMDFYLRCHPDIQGSCVAFQMDEIKRSAEAECKRVGSVQSLNGGSPGSDKG